MKRLILGILILTMCLTSCAPASGPEPGSTVKEQTTIAEEVSNVVFYRQVARRMTDDGWVYTFVKNGLKDPEEEKTEGVLYQFFVINMRYKYDDEYIYTETFQDDKGNMIRNSYAPGILIMGNANERQKRDREKLNEMLKRERTTEELLAIDPNEVQFEELNKDLFFEVMREALTSPWQKEGKLLSYWEKPSYAFLLEPDFLENYKFQVAFLQETGCVDELFIDVLYKTGEGYRDYVQLSDLIEQGKASEEQQQLWKIIREIVDTIKEQELFITGEETYQKEQIAGVDLGRLYDVLTNIHNNNFEPYDEPVQLVKSEKIS